jgi:hypothetical protein
MADERAYGTTDDSRATGKLRHVCSYLIMQECCHSRSKFQYPGYEIIIYGGETFVIFV